jgi:hypothetical protein
MHDSTQRVSVHDHLVLFSSQQVRGCVTQLRDCLLMITLISAGAWMCDSAQRVSAHDHLVLFSSQYVRGCVTWLRECLLMITWCYSPISMCVDV